MDPMMRLIDGGWPQLGRDREELPVRLLFSDLSGLIIQNSILKLRVLVPVAPIVETNNSAYR